MLILQSKLITALISVSLSSLSAKNCKVSFCILKPSAHGQFLSQIQENICICCMS